MASARQVTVTLEDDLDRFIAEEAGRHGLGSGAFIERVLRARLVGSRLQTLDQSLARGLQDAEAGRVIPLDEAFERLRRELDA